MSPHPTIIDYGTDDDAGFWLAALPFVHFEWSDYPALSPPDSARQTGAGASAPAALSGRV